MILAVLIIQSLVVAVLALLVAGLLRSHAEILRRLGLRTDPLKVEDSEGGPGDRVSAQLPPLREDVTPSHDISGTTLRGDPVKLSVSRQGRGTLLAFLSSGCSTCQGFWSTFQSTGGPPLLPSAVRLIVVTRDRSHENLGRLKDLAPGDLTLVMSSKAWTDYDIPGHPYFIYVDGSTGLIHGEGSGERWEQVMSLLSDSLTDHDAASSFEGYEAAQQERRNSRQIRMEKEDRELLESGIGPEHSSLYSGDMGRLDVTTDASKD